jgi:hypothetical protein
VNDHVVVPLAMTTVTVYIAPWVYGACERRATWSVLSPGSRRGAPASNGLACRAQWETGPAGPTMLEATNAAADGRVRKIGRPTQPVP